MEVAVICRQSLGIIAICLLALGPISCTRERGDLGSKKNPIKFFFLPSVDSRMMTDRAKRVKAYLEKNTPYHFSVSVPQNYVAVVEAFGTNRADIASLNTFGYILANEKYGVQARLTLIRFGFETYQAQIIARADSKINSLKDLKGKKFAYVDPASTSGFLLPAKLFADKGIKLSDVIFAQKHDNVVTMVYQKAVDAGATFFSPAEKGQIQDARRLVRTQFPDVEEKIKIIGLTDPIPNDPIVFRKNMPEEIKLQVSGALIAYLNTEEGRRVLYDLYGVTGFKVVTDEHYDGVRALLKSLGKSAAELTK